MKNVPWFLKPPKHIIKRYPYLNQSNYLYLSKYRKNPLIFFFYLIGLPIALYLFIFFGAYVMFPDNLLWQSGYWINTEYYFSLSFVIIGPIAAILMIASLIKFNGENFFDKRRKKQRLNLNLVIPRLKPEEIQTLNNANLSNDQYALEIILPQLSRINYYLHTSVYALACMGIITVLSFSSISIVSKIFLSIFILYSIIIYWKYYDLNLIGNSYLGFIYRYHEIKINNKTKISSNLKTYFGHYRKKSNIVREYLGVRNGLDILANTFIMSYAFFLIIAIFLNSASQLIPLINISCFMALIYLAFNTWNIFSLLKLVKFQPAKLQHYLLLDTGWISKYLFKLALEEIEQKEIEVEKTAHI